MWTPKFKCQATNEFLAAVNQMFGGSSLLPTTTKWRLSNQIGELEHSSDNIVGGWEEPPNINFDRWQRKTHLSVEL